MVRIDLLIFGYRRLKIDPSDLSLFTSLLLRASIPSRINNDGTVTVRERDFQKIKGLTQGRIDFSASESLGIYGSFKRLRYKGAILTSVVISLLFVLYLSGLVWDIRVDGNNSLTDAEIVLALADSGFEIGNRWRKESLSQTEAAILDKYPEIAWININRRGSVAYVKIIEKEGEKADGVDINSPSNLVASVDCIIEEITVRRGIAVVKPGDVVRRGDLLVLGAYPEDSGGEFCAADATVIGRINDTISVELSREYSKKTEINKKLYSCDIKIFNFSINIFKRYRNLTNDCVIIENEKKYSLFDKASLPISVSSVYQVDYSYENAVYSDEELVNIASERLSALTLSRIEGADLLRIRTSGGFTDGGYLIKSDIVFLSEISERVMLDIQK